MSNNANKKLSLFILDIDRTIAESKYVGTLESNDDWDKAYQMCVPMHPQIELAKEIAKTANDFVILTGRRENAYWITSPWLKSTGLSGYELRMRKEYENNLPAAEYKKYCFMHYAFDYLLNNHTVIVFDDDYTFTESIRSLRNVIIIDPADISVGRAEWLQIQSDAVTLGKVE
jgi:hypothetical protein